MALNLVFLCNNIFVNYLLIGVLNYFTLKYLLTTWHLDLATSINVEDFFILNFYFFWTSAHHLLTFIVLALILTYSLLFYFSSLFFYVLLYFWGFLYAAVILTNTTHSLTIYLAAIENYNVNLLLTNNVNRIHPFLFYISFFIFFLKLPPTVFSNFQEGLVTSTFYSWASSALLILSFSLYLGSWWALQEGSWGGWWNWDPSEVFGLCLLYQIARTYHMQLYASVLQNFLFFSSSYCFCLLFYYFLMQLNFTLISHNFGFSNNYFVFENFFLGTVVYILLGLVFAVATNRYFVGNYVRLVRHTLSIIAPLYLLLLVVILIIAPVALLNYNLYLGSVTSAATSSLCLTLLITYLLVLLHSVLPFIYGITTIFTWNTSLVYLLPSNVANNFTYSSTHVLTFFIILIIYFFANKSHSWIALVNFSYIDIGGDYASLHTLFFNELASSELFTNSPPHNTFSLRFYDNTFYQTFLLAEEAWAPPLTTLDYALSYMSLITLYLSLILLLFVAKLTYL